MKIVLALDSSPTSEVIISEVTRRPWPRDAVFHVIQVVDSMVMAQILNYYPPRVKEENERAAGFLRSAVEQLQDRGLEAAAHLIEGYPRTSIVDYAREWDADFVLVGSHGRGAIAGLFFGNVARSVVDHAHCSVEIVRAGRRQEAGTIREPMRLLLATDGSEFSTAAARSIAARPWPEHTEVKVVSVVDLVVPTTDPWNAGGEVMERLHQDSINLSEDAVAQVEKILASAHLNVTGRVVSGTPKWQLVDEAKDWGADLIIVGSHGKRGITRLLLGSVSAAVAAHAHCSVEVIREPSLLKQ